MSGERAMRTLVVGLSMWLWTGCESPGAGNQQTLAECSNGVQDGFESAIDCGGGTCAACADGLVCRSATDCVSAYCDAGICATGPSCTDRVENGSETGIDCGGACPGCPAGSGCGNGNDCLGGVCNNGLCAEAASCSDAQLSPGETDIDCGGACTPCGTDKTCKVQSDCLSQICTLGKCREPSCTDSLLNQDETDVDCGGACGDCVDGKMCKVDGDCVSTRCAGLRCSSCTDGQKNGDETGTDCGGECGPCGSGVACAGADDCTSGRCEGGQCATCDDGRRSGFESAIDCGGECDGCNLGQACNSSNDCESGSCANRLCRSCNDGIKNGGETGIDCGQAECAKTCGDGQGCSANQDCVSGRCTSGTCTSCTDGKKNGDETGVDCGGACQPCVLGTACNDQDDCAQGICESGFCCQPNACGTTCGPAPIETCNDRDDDCDGQTDEGDLGPAPLCAKQLGVCAGSRSVCDGGWVCGDTTYRNHDVWYQTTEYSCDNRDNDCDGQTDEGLRNACGGCGPLGPDICDEVDNDCDGMTDEIAGCTSCLATPTVVRFSPATGSGFGGPPVAGTFRARDANTVWSVHTEPTGELNKLYVTRFVDGAQVVSTSINDRVLAPTMALLDGFMGVVGRADFGNFAKRYHRIDITGTPRSLGIEIVDSITPATTSAQRFFLDDPDTGTYCDTVDGVTTLWAGSYDETPQWLATYQRTYTGDMYFYESGSFAQAYALRNTASNLIAQDLESLQNVRTLGPRASSVELGTNTRGDVVVFDVDTVTGALRAYYTSYDPNSWQTGSVPFPADLKFLGGDIVEGGPIMALALDGAQRLVSAVLVRGGGAWTTVTHQVVPGLVSAAMSEVSVDDAGRIHLLAEVAGTPPERIYLVACPGCPNGACVGASGPIVLNEVLYDTVGADNDVFVELRGTPGQSLAGYSLVGLNGDNGEVYRTIALTGIIPASGLYLVATTNGNATLKASAQLIANVDFQNGPDGVALRGPEGETVDALGYAAAGANMVQVGEGTPAIAAAAGQSLARTNGVDTQNNLSDFTAKTPTPGAAN